jgi:hypothetical protein
LPAAADGEGAPGNRRYRRRFPRRFGKSRARHDRRDRGLHLVDATLATAGIESHALGWPHALHRDDRPGGPPGPPRLRPGPAPTHAGDHPTQRPAPAVSGHRWGGRRRPNRHLDLPRPRQGGEPAPRPRGVIARPLRRVGRSLRPGRRHRGGAGHALAGSRGRAGRVLPLHLWRAPGLGGVSAGDAPPGQVADPGPIATGGFPPDRAPAD